MTRLSFFLFVGIMSLLFSCTSAPEGEKAVTEEKKEVKQDVNVHTQYVLDATNSKIKWRASKPTGEHTGEIGNIMGAVSLDNEGKIALGKFVIPVATLTVTDLEGDYKQKLEGHLKSGDFLDTEKHPTANFQITGATPATGEDSRTHMITGNLTLMEETKSVSFPAMVKTTDNSFFAKSMPFTIDRTQWGVKYGSGTIGTVQDKLIHDEVGLELFIAASKEMK